MAKPQSTTDAFTSSERIMQTFRMTRELVTFMKGEAAAHVNRMLEGIRTWFGLPHAATALLEADRDALGLDRYDYLLHVLFQRSLELREKGAGFDAPTPATKKR